MSVRFDAIPRQIILVLRHTAPVLLVALLCLFGDASSFASAAFPVRYNGTMTVLANGSLTTPQGVAVDLSGNVYIADTGDSRIIKVTAGGTTSTLSISGATLIRPWGLAIDSSGNLYIADAGTSPTGINSQVVKVSPSGTAIVIDTQSLSLSGAQGVAINASGDIFISDTNNSRIVKVTSGGTASLLATSSGVSLTSLDTPTGLAVDPFGNLYVVDSNNNRVVEVTTALVGSTLSTSGTLAAPVAVGVGMNGNVYISDGPTHQRIAVVTPQGDRYDLFFDQVNSDLGTPSGIAVSPTGTIYVADSGGNKVNAFQSDTAGFPAVQLGSSGTPQTLRFTINGTATITGVAIYTSGTQNLDFTIAANSGTPCAVSSNAIDCTVNVQFTPTIAGLRRGALVLSYTDINSGTGSLEVPLFSYGSAPVAALSPSAASVVSVGSVSVNQPFQTARDGVGNIYVTSYQNSTVLKIPAGGGSGSTVTIPSLPTPNTLNSPTGLAIDGAGNLFIADYNNSRIVEVTPSGTAKVIAIRGLSSGLSFPTTMNFTPNGRLLVSDYGNGRIIMLSPDIYHSGSYNGDGSVGYATAYVLPLGSYTIGSDNSTGVVADAMGNVYFTDQNSNRIIKIDPFGKLTTLSLPSLTLNAPLGVAVDPMQNIYVVDSGNQRVIQQTTNGNTSVVKYSGPSLGQFIFGVDPDGFGNLLISDFINNRLIMDVVSESSLAFPTTRQYSRSATKTTTVTNLGDQPLVFSSDPGYSVNFSQDTTDTNPCSSSMALVSNASCDVPIIFSPQVVGNLGAAIAVTNNSQNIAGTPELIFVSGTSTNPGDTTSTTKTNPTLASYSYGQPITISVKVADLTNTSAIPTGTVVFTDALTSTITQKTLDNAGNATLLNNNVLNGIGTHSILASYGGVSGLYLASSTTINITINKDTVSMTGPNQVSVTTGQTGNATITVTPIVINSAFASGASLPSGTITYSILNGSTTIVGPTTATLTAGTASSTAGVAIPGTLASGSYTISVSYAGDGNYQAASATTIPLTVAQITPTITWSPSTSITYGSSLNGLLTASASNGSTGIPGAFTYTATPSGGSAGTVTSATVLSAGTYTLTAAFTPTDTTTYSSKSANVTLTVSKATPTIAWSPSSSITYGTTLSSTLNTSASFNSDSVAGAFTYTAAPSGGSAGTVTSSTMLSAGTYTLTTTFTPTDTTNYSTNSASIALTVSKATPTITWSPSSSIAYGTTLSSILNATASFSSNSVAGTFAYTAVPSGGSASAVIASTVLATGTYALTATFTPTDITNYASATSATTLVVGKAPAAATLVSSLNPSILTGAITFTATVTATAGTPSGTVSFYDGTTLLGTVTISSGNATYTTSSLATGTHSVTAVYSGDNNFATATSSAIAELIQDFTISTPSSTPSSTLTQTVIPGGTATYTLNIGPSSGTVFPAPVTLSLSGLPPGATGTLTPTTLPAGSSLSSVSLTIQLPQMAKVEALPNPLHGAPLVLALLLLPFARKWRRAGKKIGAGLSLLLMLAVSAGALIGLSGCASNNGYFGQAPTTYTVTITATSGSLSHSTYVTLIVE